MNRLKAARLAIITALALMLMIVLWGITTYQLTVIEALWFIIGSGNGLFVFLLLSVNQEIERQDKRRGAGDGEDMG